MSQRGASPVGWTWLPSLWAGGWALVSLVFDPSFSLSPSEPWLFVEEVGTWFQRRAPTLSIPPELSPRGSAPALSVPFLQLSDSTFLLFPVYPLLSTLHQLRSA
jgi:hypothetical protein